MTLGTLRSDNDDVHEKVTENRLRILSNHFAIFPSCPVTLTMLKRKEFILELKRGGGARVQTEMVEFIACRSRLIKT